MDQTQICRLCLQNVTKFEQITSYLKRKILFISGQHKIQMCSRSKWYACYNCVQELDSCCSFKQTLVETEEKIIQVARGQPVSRNLKSMLNIDDPNIGICRLCLKICNEHSFNLFQSEMNIMPYQSIKIVCDDIFDMDLNLSDEPIMCYPCWESLQKTHALIKILLRTQLCIDNFLSEREMNKLKSEDLKKVIEDNVPRGQTQYTNKIIEIKVEEEVKEEELSQKQNKIDCEIKVEVKIEPNSTEIEINGFDNNIQPSSSSENNVEPVPTSSEAITCKTEDLEVEENFIVNDQIKIEIDNVELSDCKHDTDSVNGLDTSLEGGTGNKEKLMLVNREIITTTTVIIFSEETYKKIMANTSIVDVSGQVYRCRSCRFTTPYKQNLLPHMRKHLKGSVKFDCDLCSYSTNRGSRMRNHKLSHQSQVAALYQCDFCSYSTFTKDSMEKHNVVHGDTGNMEKLRCDQCDYTSFRKESLIKHLKRHPKMRVFACYYCEKKFSRKYRLNEHILSKHTNPVNGQKFCCTHCDYTSFKEEALSKHLRRHPKMKVYPCYFCGKNYSKRCTLNKHTLLEHENQVPR